MRSRIAVILTASTLVAACADSPTVAPATLGAQAARGAPPTECAGVITGVVPGNLVVPAGSHCTIAGATVLGNVQVEPGAAAFSSFSSTIEGSVHAPGPLVHSVWIIESGVGHGVDIRGTAGPSGSVVCGSRVGGNVKMIDNVGEASVGIGYHPACVRGNEIGGNVIMERNALRTTVNSNIIGQSTHVNQNFGSVTVVQNRIRHTLECQNNAAALVSAGNAAKNYVGQCPA